MIQFTNAKRFIALGDGNCLYNTEAVWLVYAYQQGLLNDLIINESIASNFAKLFTNFALQENIPEISNILNVVNAENIKEAFNKFILHCTNNNNEIDWIRLQQTLAQALRTLVIEAIKVPSIEIKVKKNLTLYINNMINSVYDSHKEAIHIRALYLHVCTNLQLDESVPFNLAELDFHQKIQNLLEEFSPEISEPIIGKVKDDLTRHVSGTLAKSKMQEVHSLQNEVLASLRTFLIESILSSLDDVILPVSSHFEGMPSIKKTFLDLFLDTNLKTKEDIRESFMRWFFEGEKQGFNTYLYGTNGIALPGIEAGELEQMVLSELLGHGITFSDYIAIDGFNSLETAKYSPERKLKFEMEKLPRHWNALLPDNSTTQAIIQLNDTQRIPYIEAKDKENSKRQLAYSKTIYGSYARHHATELSFLTKEEYCTYYRITLQEYDENSTEIPKQPPPEIPVENPPEVPVERPEEVPQPPDPKEPPLPNPTKQPKPGLAPKQLKPVHEEKLVGNSRDWFNYLLMMWTFAASLAMFTYGLIWPLWFPMMTTFFAQTVLASYTYNLSITLSAIFCFGISFLFTEKIFADMEKEERVDNFKLPVTNSDLLVENSPSPHLLLNYGNKPKVKEQETLIKNPIIEPDKILVNKPL